MGHKFATLESLGTELGIELAAAPAPRTELNGVRVKAPNNPMVYLVDQGYKRWIPNPSTYNNLFRDWTTIVVDIDVDAIPTGAQISDGAILARAVNTAPVYLIDQGVKRWIVSPAAMDKYDFDWGKIKVVDSVVIDALPRGPDIS
jgi:hypothetical protein